MSASIGLIMHLPRVILSHPLPILIHLPYPPHTSPFLVTYLPLLDFLSYDSPRPILCVRNLLPSTVLPCICSLVLSQLALLIYLKASAWERSVRACIDECDLCYLSVRSRYVLVIAGKRAGLDVSGFLTVGFHDTLAS